jgi:pimeloyl-ACP methyl ester carboxylesterase
MTINDSVKRQLLFVQGGGAGTHDDWDSKLVESLRRELGQGYEIHYPRMPDEDNPSYSSWRATLEKMLETLNVGAILVGHSVGATILIKLLAEHTLPRPRAILLIAAPFVGKGGWSFDELELPGDLGARIAPGVPVHFFQGLEDETAPALHVDLYSRAVPQAHIHRLPGRDHQLNDDLSEVAAVVLSLG